MTLHDIRRASAGFFKASALGAYERGERHISLERFCRLAELLGVPADQLLAEALGGSASRRSQPVIVHLDRLSSIKYDGGRPAVEFIDSVRQKRGTSTEESILLRSTDLDELSRRAGTTAPDLLDAFGEAIELP